MEWIKCSERLPISEKFRTAVLVYGSPQCGTHSDDFIVMEAYFQKDGYFEFGEYDCSIKVTHWMPLPKPPEEDESFQRTGAQQNIDPKYIQICRGISDDLLGKSDD